MTATGIGREGRKEGSPRTSLVPPQCAQARGLAHDPRMMRARIRARIRARVPRMRARVNHD